MLLSHVKDKFSPSRSVFWGLMTASLSYGVLQYSPNRCAGKTDARRHDQYYPTVGRVVSCRPVAVSSRIFNRWAGAPACPCSCLCFFVREGYQYISIYVFLDAQAPARPRLLASSFSALGGSHPTDAASFGARVLESSAVVGRAHEACCHGWGRLLVG